MEGVSEGPGSVGAAMTPRGLPRTVFGRDEGRSHLQVYREIPGSAYFGFGTQSLLVDRLLVCLINMLQVRM